MQSKVSIPRPAKPLPRDEKVTAGADRLVQLHRKGIFVDSTTVVLERLNDGRYRPHLHPDIIGQLKALGVKII